MRTIGIIFLALTPLLWGLDYRNSLKKRKDFLNAFKEFIMYVKEQIRFSGRERDEIFALALNDPRFGHPLFKKIEKALKSGQNISKTVVDFNDIRLKIKEISGIDSFISGLGKSDLEGQLNHCDHYLLVFEKLSQNSDEVYAVKGKLVTGLSLSLASVMFIIMI